MLTSSQIEQSLVTELKTGERLLWTGTPDFKRAAKSTLSSAWVILVMFIPIMMFIPIFQTASRHHQQDFPYFVMLMPMLIVLLIIVPILFSIFTEQQKIRGTVYGLTDQRAIIISETKQRSVKSYYKNDIRNLERIDLPNNTGDVIFARPEPRSASSGNGLSARAFQPIGFIGIPNPRDVENLIVKNILKSAE
jgi:hypothetical protein